MGLYYMLGNMCLEGLSWFPQWKWLIFWHLSQRINAPEIARGIRAACEELGVEEFIARTSLKGFAAREGEIFDESDVTVSFSPQIGFPHSTITEHPNQPERTMIDISRPFPPSWT